MEQVIDAVHLREVPGVFLCRKQADSKGDHSNNQQISSYFLYNFM